jgi:asparaginyl-tRNA synthetase
MEDSMNKVAPIQSWKNMKEHYIHVLQSDWYKLIYDLQNEISFATYDFYKSKDIKTVYLPITTGSISSPMGLGSDSLPVQVVLCGEETYLADSMQFMLEYACRMNKNGCFYIMPSFRGEKADERHLCQFYHSEVEIPGTLEDIMNLVEEYVKFLSQKVLDSCKNGIVRMAGGIEHIEKMLNTKKIPRVLYDDAIRILSPLDGCVIKDEYGFQRITNRGEKELIKYYGGVVWLYKMDKRLVPFYQAVEDVHGRYAECADLLFGIGEVVGCGERHATGDAVRRALQEHTVPESDYEWYIRMKDEFPLRTSGFGMGIERFLLWVLQYDDIRDCQLIPRFNGEKNYL